MNGTPTFEAPLSGVPFSELPEEYQDSIVKEYFERSPYATICKLANGKFLVRKCVTMCFIPCPDWSTAASTRECLRQTYVRLERAFA